MPRYEWTGGPNILGALDPGVQVSRGPTILRQREGEEIERVGRGRERVLNFYTSYV